MPRIDLSPRAFLPGVRNCARTFCCLLTLSGFLTIANAQNNSTVFDGTDDYIDCGNDPAIAATNIKTMECWVKFSDFSPSGAKEILSKSTLGQGFELILFNAQLGLFIMGGGSESNLLYSTASMTTDTWYHIAGSWDGSTKESMKLYVNGVTVAATPGGYGDINVSGISDPASSFKIGSWQDPGWLGPRYFTGTIDEVRVWGTERTQSEIKGGMYGTVSTGASGLIAYYKMDEGSGTTAANSTANTGLDGTLNGSMAWATSPVQAGNNSISLDGVNDYVSIPNIAAYDFTSGTIECRIKPASVTATNDCFITSRDGGGTRYSFHINTTGIYFDNGTSTQTVTASFSAGTSYLISLVTNGSNIDAYVDGVLAGSFTQTFGAASGKPILIGATDIAGTAENFEGSIDEVRFWSTERTALEITGSASNLVGNEAGLIGLFNFNQGVSEGDNSGLRVILDGTTANNHGTLNNLALTGTSSNFITGLVVLPVRLTAFSLAKSGYNVVVKWQTSQEQNSLKFEVERSADGVHFTKIGSVAAAGNSSTPKDYSFTDYTAANGKNFYRLKQIDLDGKSVYTTVKLISISANDKLSWSLAGDKSVVVSLLKGTNEKYQLIDISGRVLQKGILNGGRVTSNNLRSGRYTVVVEGKDRMVTGFIVP